MDQPAIELRLVQHDIALIINERCRLSRLHQCGAVGRRKSSLTGGAVLKSKSTEFICSGRQTPRGSIRALMMRHQ
jgi:hypothetical protein